MGEVDVRISKDLIAPIIEAKINAAIVSALGDPRPIVERAVERMMSRKVDSDGKHNSYDSYNKYTMVEHLSKTIIEDAIKSALLRWASDNKKLIEESVRTQLARRPSIVTKAVVEGMTRSFADAYKLKVEVQVPSYE